MALILCVETSTERCSVVVADKGKIVGQTTSSGDFEHSSQLTLLVNSALQQSPCKLIDLDAIAISIGPGSYTSLRSGLSTAKGLCYGLNVPLLSIDSLSIIAAGSIQEQVYPTGSLYVPMIDARRMEVYAAVYSESGEVLEKSSAMILTNDSFRDYFDRGVPLVFAGNGAHKFSAITSSPLAQFSLVHSSAVYMPALAEKAFQQKEFADLAYSEPHYLKPPNITAPKKMHLGS